MLNRTEIQKILESEYKQDNWLKLIKSISSEPVLLTKPTKLNLKSDLVNSSLELGSFETTDGMKIGLYEIEIEPNVQIERNRVGLRNLLRAQYRQVDGCFAVYYQGSKWRFSYISETRELDENNEWIDSKTEPKRYTYVLGEGETIRTACDRFEHLFISDKNLSDIKEAFSIEGVTDEFYSELRNVYNEIQDYITGIDEENKKVFAQLILNRLLFLRFLEKKGWLFTKEDDTPEIRKKYFSIKRDSLGKQNQWSNFFVHLFFKGLNRPSVAGTREITDNMKEIIGYVPYLNGGLFEESKDWNDYEIKVDNRLFFAVFDKLFNNFNFTVSENTPLDIEVALNPDLLGYAYEEMIAERHGQGAYYTHPTEVGLMCRESIKTYLKEHTEIEYDKLIDLVNDWNPANLIEDEALDIYKLLLNVKILDPAVGSGAYPVRMMQELTEIHFALSQKLSTGTLKQIVKNKLTDPTSFYELKRSIIQNNLYGADIDHFAVEIAKLRFWLSIVVDFNEDVKTAKDLEKIPALPNLDFKLRTGDSLLAIPGRVKTDSLFDEKNTYVNLDIYLADERLEDFFNSESLDKLRELKNIYFDFEEARKHDKSLLNISKDDLKEQIAQLEISFIENMGFKLQEDPESLKHIIWPVHFAEIFDKNNFGFDICIANPPYLRQEKINEMFETFKSDVSKDDLIETYEKLYQSLRLKIDKKSDLYVYFFLRGLNLLKDKGVLCYICSNSWLDVGYGRALQEVLLHKTRIISIFDNIAKRSFAKADINTTINLFVKDSDIDFAKNKRVLRTENIVKFTAFKKDFDISTTSLIFKHLNKVESIYVNANYRCYTILQKELLSNSFTEEHKYEGDKWGSKYLRAPDIYFNILTKSKNSLLNLGDTLSYIKRNTMETLGKYEILDYNSTNSNIIPYLYSVKDVSTIKIKLNSLSKSIKIFTKKIPIFIVPDIISNRFIGERLFFIEGGRFIVSDTFFVGILQKNYDKKIILTLLNSTFSLLVTEIIGRKNLGGGLLTIYGPEFRKILILKPELINKESLKDINEQYANLSNRDISSIFVECGINVKKEIRRQNPTPIHDRKIIDDIVFDSLGLSIEERNEVYWSLCELVQNRLKKAKNV